MRRRWPVAIPAGIFAVILRSRPTRPAPRHAWQGLLMIRPLPRHAEHGRATVRNPCWERIWPDPLHCVQTSGALAVGALDRRVGGVAWNAEDLVIVPLAHPLATFTIAGRSSRSPSM